MASPSKFVRRLARLLPRCFSVDADERDIITFLKSWQGQFVSGREVSKRAGGKWRYRKEPNWAASVLARMVESGQLEADATGHFRIRQQEKKNDAKWVSPQIKAILEKSGQQFGGVISIEDEDESGPQPE